VRNRIAKREKTKSQEARAQPEKSQKTCIMKAIPKPKGKGAQGQFSGRVERKSQPLSETASKEKPTRMNPSHENSGKKPLQQKPKTTARRKGSGSPQRKKSRNLPGGRERKRGQRGVGKERGDVVKRSCQCTERRKKKSEVVEKKNHGQTLKRKRNGDGGFGENISETTQGGCNKKKKNQDTKKKKNFV